jgi:hypothetical protein
MSHPEHTWSKALIDFFASLRFTISHLIIPVDYIRCRNCDSAEEYPDWISPRHQPDKTVSSEEHKL